MSPARAALALMNNGKRPSASFLAVLAVLLELDSEGGYCLQISKRTGIEQIACRRLLYRMVRLGIAYRWDEERDPDEPPARALRVYYRLTVMGRNLAEQLQAGAA